MQHTYILSGKDRGDIETLRPGDVIAVIITSGNRPHVDTASYGQRRITLIDRDAGRLCARDDVTVPRGTERATYWTYTAAPDAPLERTTDR